jgi:hypothetical protein
MIFDRCHGALPGERVIDGARRPEFAPPSGRRSGPAVPISVVSALRGAIKVSIRMLTGVSAISKFFAARKSYHDPPIARQRDPAGTATAPSMRISRRLTNESKT